MITIKIDEYDLLNALMARVEHWTDDTDIQELFEEMYESYIFGGCFDNAEIDIWRIVDNDYINWCRVITPTDTEYNDILAIYNEQGLGDISCHPNNNGFNYIEAYKNNIFLVRS